MNYINLLPEQSYVDTTWYKRIVSGINSELKPNKEKIKFINKDDISSLKEDDILIIIGFTEIFISEAIQKCIQNHVRPLLVGSNPKTEINNNVSCVTINRENAMYENVTNLYNSGAKRIAMIGINPSVNTDVAHMNGYIMATVAHGTTHYKQDIFYNTTTIDDTIDNFIKRYKQYDAVVCTNDYVAILLLSKLNQLGIKVPDELSITGTGNTEVSAFTNPPLTTISIPLDLAGSRAATLYRILQSDKAITSLYSTFEYKIIYRQSTKVDVDRLDCNNQTTENFTPLIDSDYEKAMKPIWSLSDTYSTIDDTDKQILEGIINDLSNDQIAQNTFIGKSTLTYRLNRLYQMTNTSGKEELKNLILKFFPNFK